MEDRVNETEAFDNFDVLCAELGRELESIPEINEKIINAALAVLQEQGPFAMMLFLHARHDKVVDAIDKKCSEFVNNVLKNEKAGNEISSSQNKRSLADPDYYSQVFNNLADLQLGWELLIRAFAYAKFFVKHRLQSSQKEQ